MKRRVSFFSMIAGVLLFALVFAFPGAAVSASAESYYDEESGKTVIDTNWWFEDISVVMDVRRDKTVRITETMEVGFLAGGKNTGIIRDIQRISCTTRIIDGKREQGERYLATLSDVEVTINGEPARVTQSYYSEGQFFSVKMQKPDVSYFPATDQTDKDSYNTFVLSYVYGMGDDKAAGYDDFTFDVLGYAMDYTSRFTATVTFPDKLDKNAVSFRTNNKAEWIPDKSKGESTLIEGNTVTMTALPQKENKGYTLQVLFEDGYFETSRTFFWYYIPFVAIAACAIGAGIAVFLKYRFKRPVEQVEFYPPAGMSIMRYSAIWHGRARSKDIGAVITHWASKGFVRIEKDGRIDFTVYKLKDLSIPLKGFDDAPKKRKKGTSKGLQKSNPEIHSEEYDPSRLSIGEGEREYFHELFKPMFEGGDYIEYFSTRELKKSTDYERKRKLSSKAEKVREAGEQPNVFYPHLFRGHVLLTLTAILPFLATFIYYCILGVNALPMFFYVFIAAGLFVGSMQAKEFTSPLLYVFPVAFTAIPLLAFGSMFYIPLYDYAGLLFISLAWYVIAFIGLHFLKRRDPEIMRDFGKMRGFKRFLLTAELDRIERLFDENPDYFSDIIPFCLVMGISKKVEKRFKPLNIAAPEWANGISASSFSSMSRTLSHSSGGGSSGGGGGGGGSSGGGGGGGGSRGC